MKAVIFLFMLMGLSANALAGGLRCTATNEELQKSIKFIIDWEPDGTTLDFEQAIAWHPEALKFDIIYSVQLGDAYLVAAQSLQGPTPQVVEIHFEKANMKSGFLNAGDFMIPMKRLGKYKKYLVECL